MAVYILIAGVAVFLVGIGLWAFTLTADLSTIDLQSGVTALVLWVLASAGLIGGFLWLAHRQRRNEKEPPGE